MSFVLGQRDPLVNGNEPWLPQSGSRMGGHILGPLSLAVCKPQKARFESFAEVF
jgi:hypothetical protein